MYTYQESFFDSRATRYMVWRWSLFP